MKFLLLLDCLNKVGGVESFLAALVPEMEHNGIECRIATRLSHTPDNHFVEILLGNKWADSFPRIGPFDFYRRNWIIDCLILLFFPLFSIMVFFNMIIKKRHFSRSLLGVRGKINEILGKYIPSFLIEFPLNTFISYQIHNFKPDLIFVFRADGVRFLPIVLKYKVPVIYFEAAEPDSIKQYPELKNDYDRLGKYINRVDAVIVLSNRIKQQLLTHFGLIKKLYLIPCTTSITKEWQPISNNLKNITIGSASRLSPEKGIELFIKAAAILNNTFPDLRFVIAGGGPSERKLEQLAKNLALEKIIEFTGQYDIFSDLDSIMNRMNVYVQPSYTEGAPVSILEAMAYSKPVIATDVGGIPEIVVNDQTGIIIPPGDEKALADAIKQLITTPSLMEKMGKAGYERYQQYYSPPVVTKQYFSLANEIISLNTNAKH